MRAIGKFIQKILTIIVILLILFTIGIFVYPQVADKTELDDKAVSFLAKQTDKLVEETVDGSNEGTEVVLEESDLLIDTAQKDGYVSVEDNGVTVVMDTNLTEELIEEGFVREIVSKIQTMRKEAGFEVLDRITVNFRDSEKVAGVIARNKERIMSDVLAVEITEGTGEGHTGFWNINGEKVFLTVTKVNA